FWEENDKKLVQKSLETLYTIWGNFGETAHLLVALSMLSSDKTIRSVSAEIWIKGVNEGTIDSSLLGEIIGKIEGVEYAPLKRFTDLIMGNMFKISVHHN